MSLQPRYGEAVLRTAPEVLARGQARLGQVDGHQAGRGATEDDQGVYGLHVGARRPRQATGGEAMSDLNGEDVLRAQGLIRACDRCAWDRGLELSKILVDGPFPCDYCQQLRANALYRVLRPWPSPLMWAFLFVCLAVLGYQIL